MTEQDVRDLPLGHEYEECENANHSTRHCRHSDLPGIREACTCGQPRAAHEAAEPKPWRLRLICCGRDDGTLTFATGEEADAAREEYTSGVAVAHHGYSAGAAESGHRRAAIKEYVGSQPPAQPHPAPDPEDRLAPEALTLYRTVKELLAGGHEAAAQVRIHAALVRVVAEDADNCWHTDPHKDGDLTVRCRESQHAILCHWGLKE